MVKWFRVVSSTVYSLPYKGSQMQFYPNGLVRIDSGEIDFPPKAFSHIFREIKGDSPAVRFLNNSGKVGTAPVQHFMPSEFRGVPIHPPRIATKKVIVEDAPAPKEEADVSEVAEDSAGELTKTDLHKMSKKDLVAEAEKLGIAVADNDTKKILMAKLEEKLFG